MHDFAGRNGVIDREELRALLESTDSGAQYSIAVRLPIFLIPFACNALGRLTCGFSLLFLFLSIPFYHAGMSG